MTETSHFKGDDGALQLGKLKPLVPPALRQHPDAVRLPEDLGGNVVRVTGIQFAHCACKDDHDVPWLVLQGEYTVACCNIYGYIWCKKARNQLHDKGLRALRKKKRK